MNGVDRVATERWRTPHDSGETVTARPAGALRGSGCTYRGFRLRADRRIRRLELPTSAATLVLGWAGAVRVGSALSSAGPVTGLRSMVSGMHSYATIAEYDDVAGVQVTMSPLMAHRVFGVAMHELADRIVDVGDLTGRWGADLAERLAGAPGWAARFSIVDEELGRRLHRMPPPDRRMMSTWRRMHAVGGDVAIDVLAGEAGCSRSHLERLFQTHVGLSPKTAARVLRLRRAVQLLARPSVALADVAAACGYYDQAHLGTEFKRMVGGTPGSFRRDRTAEVAGPRPDRLVDQVTSLVLPLRHN